MPTIIDANVLIKLFREDTNDGEKVRIEGLLSDMRAARKRLVIPSPALSEFAAKATQEEMDFVLGQSVFRIAAFDAKAALECGDLLRSWAKGLDGNKKDRHKAKFDMLILAIAKSERAARIITCDKNLRSKAEREKIPSIEIVDLPIPDSARQQTIAFE